MIARRTFTSGLLALGVMLECVTHATTATGQTPEEDWISLFDGETFDGWIPNFNHHETGVNWGNTFRIEEGIIQVRFDEYGEDYNDQFGHLYYHQPFSHFRLRLEYRFVGEMHPTAPSYVLRNSGVMFHSQDPYTMPVDQDWPISVEMQFLGGLGDGEPRPTGNMCSPGTEIVYNGTMYPGHCLSSTSETYDGDQWVRAELIVLGDSLVTHIVEGDTVLQYTHPQIGGGVANNYDPAIKEDGKRLTEGFIALQAEGQPVDFRNIELLNLAGCMDPASPAFRSYFIESDPDSCQ